VISIPLPALEPARRRINRRECALSAGVEDFCFFEMEIKDGFELCIPTMFGVMGSHSKRSALEVHLTSGLWDDSEKRLQESIMIPQLAWNEDTISTGVLGL
jgi:hypothetical protein